MDLQIKNLSKQYNNGVVANPWTGAELYFPVSVDEEGER